MVEGGVKRKLIFIPAEDYDEIKRALKDRAKTYDVLEEKGIEHFMVTDAKTESSTVYIPSTHKEFFRVKAKKGEAL